MNDISLEEIKKGKLLLIDKTLDWSSFDVVKKIKYTLQHKFKDRKIKVGHAGTLDPLASGLMIICTGGFTKRINEFQELPKEYIAKISLGATTPSFDLETGINAHFPTEHITLQLVINTLNEFIGRQLQVPPLFSAKKVGGKRAYEFARKGSEMVLEPNEIIIHGIEVVSFTLPDLVIRITCSKGTYIRSLARDIGEALNSGGHLTELRRTAIGPYKVDEAMSIKDFEKASCDCN
ncbi:MAG: tRNA pseudouridine(55) synthase TruB [Bacteroidota bacterium]